MKPLALANIGKNAIAFNEQNLYDVNVQLLVSAIVFAKSIYSLILALKINDKLIANWKTAQIYQSWLSLSIQIFLEYKVSEKRNIMFTLILKLIKRALKIWHAFKNNGCKLPCYISRRPLIAIFSNLSVKLSLSSILSQFV